MLANCEREGVAVVNMTAMHQSLLSRKRYEDMTGNNVNHPNDYLARVYAQTLFATLQDNVVITEDPPMHSASDSELGANPESSQSDASQSLLPMPEEQGPRPTGNSFFGLLFGGCMSTATIPACAATALGAAAILKKKKDE